MSTRHTPENWKVLKGSVLQMLTGLVPIYSDTTEIGKIFRRENADRIVDCVNAMSGIPDPAAFMEVVRHLELDAYHTAKEKLDNALRSNNELTAHMLQITKERDALGRQMEQIESLVSTFTEHHLNAIGEAAYTAFWFKFNEITGTNAGGGGA
jgi:hypothetical protein